MKGESSQGQLGQESEGQVVGGCGEEVGLGRGGDGGVGGPFTFRNSKPSGKMSNIVMDVPLLKINCGLFLVH